MNGQNCADVLFETNHTTISCYVGEGVGANHSVVLQVAGQNTQATVFSYEGTVKSRWVILTFSAGPIISSVSSVPTVGGTMTVQGSNFGPTNTDITLTVSGINCTGVRYVSPHTSVACDISEGVGKDYTVYVGVAGQNTTANFAYEGTLYYSHS